MAAVLASPLAWSDVRCWFALAVTRVQHCPKLAIEEDGQPGGGGDRYGALRARFSMVMRSV